MSANPDPGTFDFVEEAIEPLLQSGDRFILFIIRDKKTLIESSLTSEDKVMLREWVDTGHWNRIIESRLP
jgi:hypothetical protein